MKWPVILAAHAHVFSYSGISKASLSTSSISLMDSHHHIYDNSCVPDVTVWGRKCTQAHGLHMDGNSGDSVGFLES